MRVATRLALLLGLLVLPLSAHADDDLEEVMSDLAPQQRIVYRAQLLELERVSRRLLQAIPNPPHVHFTMAEEVPETATAGFFSSHPSSVERAAELQREAAQLGQQHEERRAVGDVPGPQPLRERNEEACRKAKPYFYRAKDAADLEEKVALYHRGLRLCPQSPRAHAELAEVYADLGNEREAAEELREVLRYDPDYPGANRRLRELEDGWSGVTY